MSCIQIYHSVTGELAPGSDQDGEGLKPVITQEYQNEVLFYHAPEKPELRCYLKIQRNAPEQYMAVYRGEGDWRQQMVDFRALVEDRVQNNGGRLITDGSRNQIVYDRLRGDIVSEVDTDAIESELVAAIEENSGIRAEEFGDLAEELREDGALEFLVPSAARAVDVLAYVRARLGADWSVAISRSGRTETIADADVVIIPDESVDRVRLGETGNERIRKSTEEAFLAETIYHLSSLRNLFNREHEDPDPAIASALNENGAPEELGVYFTNGDNRSVLPSLRALKSGTKLAIALGVLFFVGYYWSGVSSLFTKPVSYWIESSVFSLYGSLEVWVGVIVSLLVIGFVGLATFERRQLLWRVLTREEGSGSSAGEQDGTAPSQDSGSTVDEHAVAAVTDLAKLQDLWDQGEYHERLEKAVQRNDVTDLQFIAAAKRKRSERIGRLLNVVAALVPVALALAAVFLFGGRAVRFLDAEYVNLARVFVWGGIFSLVMFVAEVVLRTLSRGLSVADGDDGRPAPEERLARLRASFERGNTTVYFRNPPAYVALLDHQDEEIRTETARLLRANLDEQQVSERVEEILGPAERSHATETTVDEPGGVGGAVDPEQGAVSSEDSSRGGVRPEESTPMSMERSEDGRMVRGPEEPGAGDGDPTTVTSEPQAKELGGTLSHDGDSASSPSTPHSDATSYPSYRFGPTNTGYSRGANRRDETWSARWTEPLDHELTAPVIGEGRGYIGAGDGRVWAIDLENGSMDVIETGGEQVSFPPVLDPETEFLCVISTTGDGSTLHRYDLDGTAQDSVPLDAEVSCPAALDGSTVVVGDEAGSVYNIDVGAMRVRNQRSSLSGPGRSGGRPYLAAAPVMDDEKRLAYFVSSDGELYKLDWNGGVESVGVHRRVKPFPPVWDEATRSLVVVTESGPIVRIGGTDADDFPLPSPVSGPFSVADGIVYAALEDDRLEAIDMRQNGHDGRAGDTPAEWPVDLPSWNGSRSVTVGGDTVYVAGDGVRAFDRANGSPLWHYEETSGRVNPVAVVEGTVVVTDGSNTVHVLDV